VGAGGGWAFAHDIDDFSQGVGKDATAINAFVGYNYNENLGAELGYLSTGDWDIAGQDFNSKGATLSVIGRLPLGDIFSVFAEGAVISITSTPSTGGMTIWLPWRVWA